MASPAQRLQSSLTELRARQKKGITAIRATDLSRTHRERLLANGYLREVIKGWYFAIEPGQYPDERSAWHAGYWPFCADYLNRMRKDEWCLSPAQSIALHTGNRRIPEQLRVRAIKARNNATGLPEGLSLLEMRSGLPAEKHVVVVNGLRLYRLPAALVACSARVFLKEPVDLRIALTFIDDVTEILELLLETGRSTVAGRLAGAFRHIGRPELAESILDSMRKYGYDVRETDPFAAPAPPHSSARGLSPWGQRVFSLWREMRPRVIDCFPRGRAAAVNARRCLRAVDDVCFADAWHSLAIDGLEVTPGVLDRVRSPDWRPVSAAEDETHRPELAARGHWRAFLAARGSLERILARAHPADVIRAELGNWQREMIAPLATAIPGNSTAQSGYREGPALPCGRHVAPEGKAIGQAMDALFLLLRSEDQPAVRAVLGHFFLLYLKPFAEGNGRLARLLMNVLLASGGLPWTVIPAEQAGEYQAAAETACVAGDIVPLARRIESLTQMLHLSAIGSLR